MAVNKNFVVKNGLEVDTNTLFVDSANNRVAIGTTVPTAALDVRGKILSDSQVESFVGKFVGIVTAGAVGVTTMTATDAVVSGFSTLGKANATSLNVTTGFSTVQSLTATDLTVSIGATVTKDLNVGAAATVGAALTVTGDAYFNSDININKSLDVGEDLNVGAAATVGAALTVTGASKFAEFSRFEKDIAVGGATTVGGALTVTGNAYFNGNVDINGDLTYDEVNSRNINISGIATLGFATAGNAFVSGMTTTHLLNVGFGATMVKVQGTPATRVGINSIGPAFTLDVDGDSNVTGTVRQGGTALTEIVSGDATALAIALG
jgi:acyl-[acyl carrier protein]--UDP-N-acetylglucosamine O-acyltransferase